MKHPMRWTTGWYAVIAVLAAACGAAPAPMAAATPQMVAAFPAGPSGNLSPAGDPDGPAVAETVYLELEVSDPDGAAAEAARLARMYGGYETDRYGWFADGGRVVSQEILVPSGEADTFRSRLVQLGWKRSESVTRRPEGYDDPWYRWTQFSIRFVSEQRPVDGWHGSPFDWIALAVCGFLLEAAAVLARLIGALLLAAAVVIPCIWMIVGAVTTVRWLSKK